MKNIQILKKITLLIILVVLFNSCKKWIDTDLNKDPSKPLEVSLALQLPTAQIGIGYNFGGDLSYAALIWMQQLSGGGAQALAYDWYSLTQTDINNAWNWNTYAGPGKELYMIMQKAEKEGNPYYLGVAQILMALEIGTMTDLWGDIPYSQAFKGETELHPGYDTQQQIYTTIFSLLNSAIANLESGSVALGPGGDDLIYGGNLSNWIKAANTLKARYSIHLSKINGDQAYQDALTALQNGFTSNNDDMEVPFGVDYSNSNPFYQFYWFERPGDIVLSKTYVDRFFGNNDPRAEVYFTGNEGYEPGAGTGSTSDPGDFFSASESPVILLSYVEAKFIEAEAKFQTNDPGGAATAYNDALKASLAKFGVTDTDWENANANETDATITLEKIMNQKYMSMFLQIEVFTDWRRTGFPVLEPSQNNTTNNRIPRRYPYPTSERAYNNANIPTVGYHGTDVGILGRVYWDAPETQGK